MSEFKWLDNHYAELTRSSGSPVVLTPADINAIQKALQEDRWKTEIEYNIDMNADWIKFDGEINSQRFVELCLDEFRSKYEIYDDDHIDAGSIVFKIANENGMWVD